MIGSPKTIILNKGREQSLLRRHPWVFSGAIARVAGDPLPGETVDVCSQDGSFLARGAWSPHSQIRVRVWTFDPQEKVDAAFFHDRISRAIALRELQGITASTDAWRIVSAEADGLPGLIADRYRSVVVFQSLGTGTESWKKEITDILAALPGVDSVYERSDSSVRQKEGLAYAQGLRFGKEVTGLVEVLENGVTFLVDIKKGHKTGFYLDQRANRFLVGRYCSGAEVLNCFSYTGGFGLFALKGGAKHVVNVEDASPLQEITKMNMDRNGFPEERYTNIRADVFSLLRKFDSEGRSFDVIILDPPKFAESQGQVDKAARGYKDINRLAMKLLRPNGLLFTFSCSGWIKPELFQKITADAALDAGRDMKIINRLFQDADHPVNLSIPESLYLKGLMLR